MLPAGNHRPEPTIIDVSHYMPRDHGTHVDFVAPWARAVEQTGAVRVRVHAGDSALGRLDHQFAQVAGGAVDVAHSPCSLPAGRFPASCLLSLPFLCSGSRQGTRLLWSLFQAGRLPEYDGFKVLALHADSGGVLHTRDRPVTRLEDLAGLRLRSPFGAMEQALAALGAIPVALHPPQIHAAVASGQVDGAVMAWDVVAYTRTADLLPFHTDTRLYVSPLYFVMNQARYAGLSTAARAAVDQASGAALVRRFPAWWTAWERPGRLLADRPGQVVVSLAHGELERWRAIAAPAISIRGAEQMYEEARRLG